MSLLKFLLKPKRKLAKPKTKRVTLFGYVLSSHVQNRIADPKRGINKFSVITHFIAPPVVTGPETISKKDGTKEYRRYGSKLTSVILSKNKVVKSIWKNNRRECKEFGLVVVDERTRRFGKALKAKNKKKD